MEKKCACKGCRSCLWCESESFPNNFNTGASQFSNRKEDFYTFSYINEMHQAIALTKEKSILNICNKEIDSSGFNAVGFDFPGVEIIPNFLTSVEEEDLVTKIDSGVWKNSQSGRRKQDYGPKVNFKKQKVKLATFNGLPSYINEVVNRMKNITFLKDFNVVEQCNLEYVPERGSHIDPHFDDDWLWGEHLVTLNLLSDTYFSMTCPDDELCNLKSVEFKSFENIMSSLGETTQFLNQETVNLNKVKVKIPLQKRSLVILKGPARHKWKHAIERIDISSRRLCCTFRELSHVFQDTNYEKESEIGNKLLSIASSYNGSIVL